MPLAALIPAIVGAVGGAAGAATLGAAALGAGATIYAAGQAKHAANDALAANTAANDKSLAAQAANNAHITQLEQPFQQGGVGALDQILQFYGIRPSGQGGAGTAAFSPTATNGNPTPAAAPGGANTAGGILDANGYAPGQLEGPGGPAAPTPAATGGPDWAAYWAANPDLAADPSLANSHPGDLTGDGVENNDDRAAQHYRQFGQAEGRNLPQSAAGAGPPANPTQTLLNGATDVATPPTLPQAAYTRPADLAAPVIGAGEPTVQNYFKDGWFQNSPGYQYALKQGLDSVNAGFAARNMLRSGAALQALQTQGVNIENQDYQNQFGNNLSLYNADRAAYNTDTSNRLNLFAQQQARGDTNFANDRAYGTALTEVNQNRGDTNFFNARNFGANRQDNALNNLFRLAGMGQTAAGAVGAAGTNYANNVTDIYGNQADAQANAAYARANANAGLAGSLAGTASNLFANWGGGAATPQPQTSSAFGNFGAPNPPPNASPAGFTPYSWPRF